MTDNKILAGITLLSALSIAACAAYFSVVGISMLFGGNQVQVMWMGAALETGKLVCASIAYRFYQSGEITSLSSLVYIFLTVMMMGVTSIGIFGYLSNSYKKVANELSISNTKIENLESKEALIQDQIEQAKSQREVLLNDQKSLRNQLATASEQYAERGWATDQEAVRDIRDQIQDTKTRVQSLNSEVSTLSDSLASVKQDIIEVRNQDSGARAKLGPVIQTAQLFGIKEDNAVFIFIGMIMLAFDPMAVALIVAFNEMTGRHKETEESEGGGSEMNSSNENKSDLDEEEFSSEKDQNRGQVDVFNNMETNKVERRKNVFKSEETEKVEEDLGEDVSMTDKLENIVDIQGPTDSYPYKKGDNRDEQYDETSENEDNSDDEEDQDEITEDDIDKVIENMNDDSGNSKKYQVSDKGGLSVS